MDTPVEFILIFFLGALSLRISQILRICRFKKIRAKKIEKARMKAVASAQAKAQSQAELSPSTNMDENNSESQAEPNPNMDK